MGQIQIKTLTTEEIRDRVRYLDRSEGEGEVGIADMASVLQEFCIEPFASLEDPIRSSLEGEAFYKNIIYPLTFAIDEKLVHPDSNPAEIEMYNTAYYQISQNAIAFLARVNSEQVIHLINEAQKYANENRDAQYESCNTLMSNLEIECRKFMKKEAAVSPQQPTTQTSRSSDVPFLPHGQKIQNITGKATEFRVKILGTASDEEMRRYSTLFCSSMARQDRIDAPGEAFYKEFIKPLAVARLTLGETKEEDEKFKKYAKAAISCLARIMASEDDRVSYHIEQARIYCNEHREDKNPLCEKVMQDIETQARELKDKGIEIVSEQPIQKPPAQPAVATSQQQNQPINQVEQLTESLQSTTEKKAVEKFLKNPSITKSAYWKDKIGENVRMQEILDHVDGKHKGKFFSYSGKDTKTVLENYGVDFKMLVTFPSAEKKIEYICEKINAVPAPSNQPEKKSR